MRAINFKRSNNMKNQVIQFHDENQSDKDQIWVYMGYLSMMVEVRLTIGLDAAPDHRLRNRSISQGID